MEDAAAETTLNTRANSLSSRSHAKTLEMEPTVNTNLHGDGSHANNTSHWLSALTKGMNTSLIGCFEMMLIKFCGGGYARNRLKNR